jgi:hypothetical protein
MQNFLTTIVTSPLFLLPAGLALVLWIVVQIKPEMPSVKPYRFHERPGLNRLGWFAFILSPVWATILVVTILLIGRIWLEGPDDDPVANRLQFLALVGLIGALAVLVGTPLALIRVFTTERQTTATETGLITDRINTAVAGLGTEKIVRKMIDTPRYQREGDDWKRDDSGDLVPAVRPDDTPIVDRESLEYTEPNIEVRIGAIYALERIASDSPNDHIQIMEILCAYIRNNFPASDALRVPESAKMHTTSHSFRGDAQLSTRPIIDEAALAFVMANSISDIAKKRKNYHHSEAVLWAKNLKPRADLQACMTV